MLYACVAFGDACVDKAIIASGGSIALQARTQGSTNYLYFSYNSSIAAGGSIYRMLNPSTCSPCNADVIYNVPANHQVTGFSFSTNPSTGTTDTFVKDVEYVSTPFGLTPSRVYLKRGGTTIAELGAEGQGLNYKEISGPVRTDDTSVVYSGGGVARLGAVLFDDRDRLVATLIDAASVTRDVRITADIEVTQGIQNLAGLEADRVPLVANRATVVRVWADPSDRQARHRAKDGAAWHAERDGIARFAARAGRGAGEPLGRAGARSRRRQ